ncbi:MAG: hypothetical protein NDJ90_09030 [Oligoflexia bacterium]|nr:hypothetical protein [Oligoflexia bacterium]
MTFLRLIFTIAALQVLAISHTLAEPIEEFEQRTQALLTQQLSEEQKVEFNRFFQSILMKEDLSSPQWQKAKAEFDRKIAQELAPASADRVLQEMHEVGLVRVLNDIPAKGATFDLIGEKKAAFYESALTEADKTLLKKHLAAKGFDPAKIEKIAITQVRDQVPSGFLYSGIPEEHLLMIQRTGVRDGNAYGPNAIQIERTIFTTSELKGAINWGKVNARTRGSSSSLAVKLKLKPDARIFAIPSTEKRFLSQAAYQLSRLPDPSGLSPSARELLDGSLEKSMLVLTQLYDAQVLKQTVYAEGGLGNGKELQILNRHAVESYTVVNANNQEIPMATLLKPKPLITAPAVRAAIKSGDLQPVLDKFSALGAQARPGEFRDLMSKLTDVERRQLVHAVVTRPEKFGALEDFLVSEWVLDKGLLKDPEYRDHLLWWLETREGAGAEFAFEDGEASIRARRIAQDFSEAVKDKDLTDENRETLERLGVSSRAAPCPTLFSGISGK